MRHRGPATASAPPVFANVSLMVGFGVGEAGAPVSWGMDLHGVNVGDSRLSRTARTYIQNVYWRHRQTIVDVILHQVAHMCSHVA